MTAAGLRRAVFFGSFGNWTLLHKHLCPEAKKRGLKNDPGQSRQSALVDVTTSCTQPRVYPQIAS